LFYRDFVILWQLTKRKQRKPNRDLFQMAALSDIIKF
jgi:hypothetical protein